LSGGFKGVKREKRRARAAKLVGQTLVKVGEFLAKKESSQTRKTKQERFEC